MRKRSAQAAAAPPTAVEGAVVVGLTEHALADSGEQLSRLNSNDATASTALAPVEARTPIVQTEADLDAALAEVRALVGDCAAKGWALGRKLDEIVGGELWKRGVTRDDKGRTKSRWASWAECLRKEANISEPYAKQLIHISRTYSEEQARAVGVTKLFIISKAPEEDQPALLLEAREGTSKRVLAEKVQESREAKGHRKSNAGRKPKATRPAPLFPPPQLPPPPKADDPITVVGRVPGTAVIEMKKRADGAYVGTFEASNEVSQKFTFRLPKTKGKPAQLRINTKRDDS